MKKLFLTILIIFALTFSVYALKTNVFRIVITDPTSGQVIHWDADIQRWVNTSGVAIDSVNVSELAVDLIYAKDSTSINIKDDVVIDSNLTVTGNLTVSGSGLQDSIYTSAIEAVTAYISTNNTWWKAKNFAGTWGNLIKWNASDHIEFGTSVEVGSIEFEEDSGVITGMDMPVSDTPSDGVEESFSFSIDSNPVLRVGALADGTGGVDSAFVKIYGKLVLDSLAADPDSVKGTIWYGGGDDSLHIWTGAGKQTFQLNMAD